MGQPSSSDCGVAENEDEVGFSERDLEELWERSYQNNKTRLHLSDEKAREWADDVVRIFKESSWY